MKNHDSTSLLRILQLIRTPQIGPKTFFNLVHLYGTAEAVVHAWPQVIKDHLHKEIPLHPEGDAAREIATTLKIGAQYITYEQEAYPTLLQRIDTAPPLLVVKGEKALLQKPMVAIVGGRNASYNGQHFALGLSQKLVSAGLVVVSGFARGIDTSAHKGALSGGTICVMAGGLEKAYPPENERLYKEVLEKGGLFLSEMPIGTAPQAQHFPRRNRLIAGMTKGTIVVEAARKSGSLLTAEYAALYGRDVFAVPGSPLDPRCRGTNYLLKTGAYFVENHWDVLEVLQLGDVKQNAFPDEERLPVSCHASALDEKILELLSGTGLSLEDVTEALNRPISDILQTISRLESEGYVTRDETNKFVKVLQPPMVS